MCCDAIKKYQNQIYRGIYACLLFGALFGAFQGQLGVRAAGRREIAFCIVCLLYLFLFTAVRMKGRLLLLALPVAYELAQLWVSGAAVRLALWTSYLKWAVGGTGIEEYLPFYRAVQIFWLALACTLLALAISLSRKIRCAAFGASIVTVGCFLVWRVQLSAVAAAFWLAFILLNTAELIEERWPKKRAGQEGKVYVVWLWPIWLMALLLLFFAPSSPEPFRWTFVKTAIAKLDDGWSRLSERIRTGEREDFAVHMNGFSKESGVGGDLEQTDKELLRISASKRPATNLYLSGMVMDAFDGRQWSDAGGDNAREMRMDMLETVYGVRGFDADRISDYLAPVSLDIEYAHFSSAYYFTPLKATELSVERKNLLLGGEAKNELWQTKKKYKDSYHISFYQMNLGQEQFEELLLAAKENENEEEARWDSVCLRYSERDLSYADLLTYRSRISEKYGKKTELSPALKEWLDRVTYGCEGGYERLLAIENALQSLDYTTTPGELPKEIDTPEEFLDYFLLERGEGYCTYFATAFTLLARNEGYPARYVQGFCVPMKGKKEMAVRARMSHAWCEVYFEGLGWIPFEPTSGLAGVRYTPWASQNGQSVGYPAYTDRHGQTGGMAQPAGDAAGQMQDEPAQKEADALPDAKRRKLPYAAALLAIMAAALILAADIALGRRGYRRKSEREKYCMEAQRNLAVLKRLGIRRQEHETLQELGELVKARYANWGEDEPVFLGQYEEVLYAERPVSQEMLAVVRKERKAMLTHLGKWAGIWEWYYLLRTGSA